MRQLSILLIEDNPFVSKYLREILRIDGHLVETAFSGEQGVNKFTENSNNFDLVITDKHMPPGMDGIEVARYIKKVNPKMPIIMVSGSVETYSKAPDNINVLLAKPVSVVSITKTIYNLFTK